MKILITGASGFVGQKLSERLLASGHTVVPCSLRRFDPKDLNDIAAVIHLSGEPIGEGRWTTEKKKRIYDSRVQGSKTLFDLMNAMGESKPKIVISASAIGFYGDRGDEVLNEESLPGSGFLSHVCKDWERETIGRRLSGVRQVAMRFGVVLGHDGGALKQMITPFKLGVGGPIAGGKQWMSWIHVDDLTSMIEFVLNSDLISGVINAVSPNPVTNVEFSGVVADLLGTKSRFNVPAISLNLLLGEKAELVLSSQRVLPVRMIQNSFKFQYPLLRDALKVILA